MRRRDFVGDAAVSQQLIDVRTFGFDKLCPEVRGGSGSGSGFRFVGKFFRQPCHAVLMPGTQRRQHLGRHPVLGSELVEPS